MTGGLTYPVLEFHPADHRFIDCAKCGQAARAELRGQVLSIRCPASCSPEAARGDTDPNDLADELARLAGTNGSRSSRKVEVTKAGKVTLPATPATDDQAGQREWLTVVFNLDPAHPIIGGAREGLRGAAGHVVLHRAGAEPLRFEPVGRINQPQKLIEDLSWQTLASDGPVHAFKGEHCRNIAHVVRMLATAAQAVSDEQETAGIVETFLAAAEPVHDLTTYGTTAQRYEAATALQRDVDPNGRPFGAARYLVDSQTDELVIRVSDLADTARRHLGSSVARGWLEGRMEGLGWSRVQLDGHAQPGRSGRQKPHARVTIYRGQLPGADGGSPS